MKKGQKKGTKSKTQYCIREKETGVLVTTHHSYTEASRKASKLQKAGKDVYVGVYKDGDK